MAKKSTNDVANRLAQKEKELYSIQKIGQALSNTLRLDDLLNLIMKEITLLMDADRSTLYLVDRRRGEIWSKIALKAEVKEIRQKLGVGISGVVAATGETINIPDAYQDSRFDPRTDKRTGYRTSSILCLPVWEPISREGKRRIVGVIQVLNKRTGPFTASDEGILAAIASEVAVAISNARLYQKLERKFQEIDLLYEFEQMLSEEFDVREVFRKILHRSLSHLRSDLLGALFPHNGGLRVIAVYGADQIFESSLRLPESFNIDDRATTAAWLAEQLEVPHLQNTGNLEIYPVPLGEKIIGPAAILHLPSPEKESDFEDTDLRLLDLVGQKISRVLELSALRQSILQQERLSAIGQMMSTIVHDLRSPINSVYGFLELMLLEESDSDQRAEYADIMRMEIQSITNMITEILDFAKGKTSILPRKCSVRNIVKRFRPQVEQLFRNTGIELKIVEESKKLLYADLEKITRVLYNIAKNAKEAMEGSGQFIFQTSDAGKEVLFTLTDTGPGIPEELRSRLFESFVTSGKKSGTGLGLAIVKKIVEDHHGSIEIESEVGKGTSFIIRLPEFEVK